MSWFSRLFGSDTQHSGEPVAGEVDTVPEELQIIDGLLGDGAEAIPGKTVTVHYTGWIYNMTKPYFKGRQFDSSKDRGEPFSFHLGAGEVIRGWDQGVEGMRAGGQRTLIIPAELGYGRYGAGHVIPPDTALVFDVELLDVAD